MPMILAQLTDPHIKPAGRLAYRQVDTTACLAATIDHLRAQPAQPDCVLITGDLADAGRAEEYARLRDELARLAVPVFLMPGNHDSRPALRAAFPDHAYLGVGEGAANYTIESFPLRVIALDSSVPGQGGGALGAEQISWLAVRLAEQPRRPTVVAVHHPPFATGIGHMDTIGLTDAPALAEVIGRHPQVERVLSGHLHRPIETRWAGTLASTAPSTAHQVALDLRPDAPSAFLLEPPGYQLHWLAPGGGVVSHTACVGTWPGPFPFFDGGQLID
jgi:3',5'-cyclic AMP phosphodiesterase CpdA